MNGSELFDIWAPADSVWSHWAKPVLFAEWEPTHPDAPPTVLTLPELSLSLDRHTAVIVDLPGMDSVLTGLALAREGLRPVPLFNGAHHDAAVVNTRTILHLLKEGAGVLAGLAFSPDAPPAFLIDSKRLSPGSSPQPGKFDNRWMVFPQDFPSANFLKSRQIHRVLLLESGDQPQPAADLAHVLLRWQEAGLEIYAAGPTGDNMRELRVERPSSFRLAWYRALALTGFRRNSAGGFGSIIPQPSSSGSGFS
ncbi:MAG TPA: hypothetical protein VF756_04640 [Thermoanaerobaculia bacterium]